MHNLYSDEQLRAYADLLAEKVFQVHSKWPHFNQLLTWIRYLSEVTPSGETIVSLERTLLYGGLSLVAPFFQDHNFLSIDCSPLSANERGAYNKSLLDDSRCIHVPFAVRGSLEKTGLEDEIADLVLIPNLVHHVSDQEKFFSEIARILKPGGRLFIFEPILRELHQIPDDYLRYTPYGITQVLSRFGLVAEKFETEGGPFQAISYCWVQALEYFPAEMRGKMEEWYYEKHFPQLMEWDSNYKTNLVREHTSFPVSFAITARKKF